VPQVRAAVDSDLEAIGDYLAKRLTHRDPARYRRFFEYSWMPDRPNLGFLIEDAGAIRGFIGAIYARRQLASGARVVCNINSWAVDDDHRQLGLMMAKRLLDQPNMSFTCFSPSERVVELLRFFKFETWPSEKALFPIGSGIGRLASALRTRILATPGEDDIHHRRIFDDHARYRLARFVLERGDRRSCVIAGRRGRGLKTFADILYASDPALVVESIARVHAHTVRNLRTAIVGIDRRWLSSVPCDALIYRRLRPLQYRGMALAELDTLYSELIPILG
jgi:acetoacetyl-CoA synthetase